MSKGLEFCPPTGSKEYQDLAFAVGPDKATAIWAHNVENNEDGPLYSGKAIAIIDRLVSEKIASDRAQAYNIYSAAYTKQVKEQFKLKFAKDITYDQLMAARNTTLRVADRMTPTQIKEVRDSFVYALVQNVEELSDIEEIKVSNVDDMLNDKDLELDMLNLYISLKEGEITQSELEEYVTDIEDYNSYTKLFEGKSIEELNKLLDLKTDRLELVKENKQFFLDQANKVLETMNISYQGHVPEPLGEEGDVESDENAIGDYTRPHYQVSVKENASAAVKIFFGTIPKVKSFKDGVYELDTDTFLGTPKLDDNTFSYVLATAYGITQVKDDQGNIIDPIDTAINKLLAEAKYRPSLYKVVDKLKVAPKSLHAQMYDVISKYRAKPLDTLIKRLDASGSIKALNSTRKAIDEKIALGQKYEAKIADGTITEKEAKAYDKLTTELGKLYERENNLIAKDGDAKYTIELSDAESLINGYPIALSWESNFNNAFVDSTVNIYDKEKFDKFFNIVNENQIYRQLEIAANAGEIDTFNTIAKAVLNDMGITVDEVAIDKFINSLEGETYIEKTNTFRERLAGFTKSIQSTMDKSTELNPSMFSKDSFIKDLSTIVYKLTGDSAGEFVRGAGGNKQYLIQNHNMLTTVFSRAKNGDNSYFDKIFNGFMQQFSLLKKKFKDNPNFFAELDVYTYGNLKMLDSKDKGKKASELKGVDQYTDIIIKYLSGYWVGLAEADKSMQYYIGKNMTVYNPQVVLNSNEDGSRGNYVTVKFNDNSNAHKVLLNYLKAETNRIIQEGKRLETLKPEDQIEFLHYAKTPGDGKGNYSQYHYFEGLTPEILKETTGIDIYSDTFTLDEFVNSNLQLTNFLEKVFETLVNKDITAALKNGVLKKVSPVRNTIVNQALPKGILSQYHNDILEVMSTFTLNALIANVEMSMLFTTDVANFKSKKQTLIDEKGEKTATSTAYIDWFKRIPVFTSPGREGYIFNNEFVKIKPTYTSATISDIELSSSYITKENLDELADNLSEVMQGENSMSVTEIKTALGAYLDKGNTADAQAWITLPLWKQRYASHYGWTQKLEDAYNRLEAGTFTSSDLKLVTSVPMKITHAEVLFDTVHPNTPLMQFNKQSEAVLIPGMVKGTELGELLAAMNLSKVDHVIVESGKKTGAIGKVPFKDKDGNVNKLRGVVLDSRHAYLQMDVKSKGKKELSVSSQMHKNLLALIDKDTLYDNYTGDTKYTKEELKQRLEDVISTLSNKESEKLLKSLGWTPDTPYINSFRLGEVISKLMQGEISDEANNSLRLGESIETNLEVKDKMASKLLAFVKKAVVALKNFGGVGVQTSSFGITGVQGKLSDDILGQIKWFKDPSERLKGMEFISEEVDGKKTYKVNKAQVLLSHDFLQGIFEKLGIDWTTLSGGELKQMVAPEVLHGIMYRTPNQGPSSNDTFEIVGILPTGMGDTIIAYDEVTTKTGSDFDIDKMFMLLAKPNHRGVSTGALYTKAFSYTKDELNIPFNDVKVISDLLAKGANGEAAVELAKVSSVSLGVFQTTLAQGKKDYLKANPIPSYRTTKDIADMSEEELKQHRMDIYSAIMGNPENYVEIMRPLDTPFLTDLRDEIIPPKEYVNVGKKKMSALPLGNLLGSAHFEMKRTFDNAKALVGTVANHFSHQSLLKDENVGFKEYSIGIGKNGNNHTMFNHSKDTDGNSISETFVGYMNAIVDAAKDPFITAMNINSVTASTAFMLVRAGVSRRWISMFMKQPILEQYVELINATEGALADKSRDAVKEILTRYGADTLVIDTIEGLRGEDSKGEVTITQGELFNNIKAHQAGKALPNAEQLKIFRQFLIWQQDAKVLEDLIKVTKVDVNGAGKNFNSARIAYSRLADMLQGNTILDPKGIEQLLGVYYNHDTSSIEYIEDKAFTTQINLESPLTTEDLKEYENTLGRIKTNPKLSPNDNITNIIKQLLPKHDINKVRIYVAVENLLYGNKLTTTDIKIGIVSYKELMSNISEYDEAALGNIINNIIDGIKAYTVLYTSKLPTPTATEVATENIVTNVEQIYKQLGNKTKSKNIIIKSWGDLKDATKAISTEGIISTRIKMAEVHFGNPFTSNSKLQNLIQTKSTKESVEKYINWILTGETGEFIFTGIQPGELDIQRKWILEKLKSGELKNKPILYYKELGEPSHATALDWLINNPNSPFNATEEATQAPVMTQETTKAKKKHLGALFMNSVKFLVDTLGGNMMLESSHSVFNTTQMVLTDLGKNINNEELTDKITREIAANVRGKHSELGQNPRQDLDEVFSFLNDSANKEFIESNYILNNIIKPHTIFIDEGAINTIKPIKEKLDVSDLTLLPLSWDQMHKQHPKFTKALVRALFHTSGFTTSTNNFYRYIPTFILNEINYDTFMLKTLEQSDDNQYYNFSAIEPMIQNNYMDSKLVPEISAIQAPQKFSGVFGGFVTVKEDMLRNGNYFVKDSSGQWVAPAYITYKTNITNEQGNSVPGPVYLYKYLGRTHPTKVENLTYVRMNTLGVDSRGNRIKENMSVFTQRELFKPVVTALRNAKVKYVNYKIDIVNVAIPDEKDKTIVNEYEMYQGVLMQEDGNTITTPFFTTAGDAKNSVKSIVNEVGYTEAQIEIVLSYLGQMSSFGSLNNVLQLTDTGELTSQSKMFVDKILSLENNADAFVRAASFKNVKKQITEDVVENAIKFCFPK